MEIGHSNHNHSTHTFAYNVRNLLKTHISYQKTGINFLMKHRIVNRKLNFLFF